MMQINQTSFGDPVTLGAGIIPQGGTIQDSVDWEASVPTGTSFTFRVYSFYGVDVDGTPESFSQIFGMWAQRIVTGPSETPWTNNLQKVIPIDAPLGTYDCLTIVGYEEATQIFMFDFKIDLDVMTVESGLGATIISTAFSSV